MVHLAIEKLHADIDALLLGVSLDLVQEDHAVIRAFRVGHALARSRKRNDARDAVGGGLVNAGIHDGLELVVVLCAVEPVSDACALARLIHGRRETVFLQNGPLLGSIDEIVALDAEASGFAALLVECAEAAEHAGCHSLFDAALASGGLNRRWRKRLRRTAPSTSSTAATT